MRSRKRGQGRGRSKQSDVAQLGAVDTRAALMEHFKRLLPPESLPWMSGEARPTRVGFRAHGLRASEEQVRAQLEGVGLNPSPISARRGALSLPYEQRAQLTHSPLCDEGAVYVMNPSSMLAVEALDPRPGEEVLDLAAAPGGKSLLIADQMQDKGRLACVEPVKKRFFKLKDNLKRGGVTMAKLYLADGAAVGRKVPQRFDRVLLDAPCSSEARVRLDEPESWAHWSPRKVREVARKQRKLLLSALQSVKVGGRVVYSTCSLSPEENELVVSEALRRFEGEAEPVAHQLSEVPSTPSLTSWGKLKLDPRLKHALRVVPDGLYHAFFLCVLTRRS